MLPALLAALALSSSLPQSAVGAPTNEGNPSAIVANEHIRGSAAKVVNPSGQAAPVKEDPVPAPRDTETSKQLQQSQAIKPPKRPDIGGKRSAPLAPPVPQANFEGLNQGTTGVRPPDTHGAAGISHFVEVTNGRGVGVFRKSDGVLVKNTSFASFFGYTARTIFDPRVVYDKKWNRWVVTAEAFPESSTIQYVFLAVSTTSDPTGSFRVYRFDVPEPAGDFFDYPQLGLDQDAVILTGNVFTGNTYVRSRMLGIAKSDVYNGRGFSVPYFNLGTPGTVAPPIVEDNNANDFLVAANAGSPSALRLFRATGLGRSNATVFAAVNVPVGTWGVPPDARQPGTTNRLDTLNGRFQNASTQIGNQLLNVHTINVGGFPTPRWYQINTSTNSVSQSGLFFEASDSDDFNPSIAGSPVGGTSTNPIGRMFFTWSSTDAVGTNLHQARVKGSGRLATDAANLSGGTTFTTASVAYNPSADSVERWGDYSAVTIDPVASGTCAVGQRAWIVNERQISSTAWGSRFGRLGFC